MSQDIFDISDELQFSTADYAPREARIDQGLLGKRSRDAGKRKASSFARQLKNRRQKWLRIFLLLNVARSAALATSTKSASRELKCSGTFTVLDMQIIPNIQTRLGKASRHHKSPRSSTLA